MIKGATTDIGAWLRELGLGQYEAAFRDNEIDDTVLRNLTAEDLSIGYNISSYPPRDTLAFGSVH
jgi:hypothetical protein